ncbi:unnamed protein product [Fraxinus pennsylvanica]|uniref:Uncharacterized protein n=1 Tax=Fraxinus pennsylvanica TaxID=56036 RepID=A0AAD2DMF2_9LAMI|nr:unnamed protein product [Fraxinus pennsylvanica]
MALGTAKVHYGTSLSNVDWLHGGAESLLTLTNLLIVLGLQEALRKVKNKNKSTSGIEGEKRYTEKYVNKDFSLTFATVKGGGHVAAYEYPKECLAMIERWLDLYPL